MKHTAVSECKDTYKLFVYSQSGWAGPKPQKTRNTVHCSQWPSGQVIPFQEAESHVDCQVKPSPALHSTCALLQLRHQLGKQFWVSIHSLPPLGIFLSVSAARNTCIKTHGASRASAPLAEAIPSDPLDTDSNTRKTRGESLSIGLERKPTESRCLLRSLKQSLWLKPTQIIRCSLFLLIIKLLSTLSLTCERKRLNVEFINLLL